MLASERCLNYCCGREQVHLRAAVWHADRSDRHLSSDDHYPLPDDHRWWPVDNSVTHAVSC